MPLLLTPQPARHPDPTVKATALAYLIFERPDPDRAGTFLTDFGLVFAGRLDGAWFYRAAGPEPFCYVVRSGPRARFVGSGWQVGSRDDLAKLAAVAGASSIEKSTGLGGGECVRLRDPSGFVVEALYGQMRVASRPVREPMVFNSPAVQPRINATQRLQALPPTITRLGHVVVESADFQAMSTWYTRHLGLIPSDIQVLPDGSPAVAFLRLDLGDRPADHHTLALVQGVAAVYSHSAYEVVDADAIGMGQRVLREKGYRHAWGIGRHILGSQVFDYWEDPWGDKHEHYCDGDLFTADQPAGVYAVSRSAMAQWGPPLPTRFTAPKVSLAFVLNVLHNLRRSPDLSFKKLVTLARLFC